MSIARLSIIRHGLTVWDKELIPEVEIERRLKRVRQAMQVADLEVLLAYGDMENSGSVAYLTNFHPFDSRMPALAVVTQTDLDAVLKVTSRDLSYVSKYVWARSHSVDFLGGDLATKLRDLVTEHGLQAKRVGFTGSEYTPTGLLQNVSMILDRGVRNADSLLCNLRRDKSAAEHSLLRLAARKCETVLGEVIAHAKAGMTESALAAFADYRARKAGCQEAEFLVFTTDDRAPTGWSPEHFPFRPPAESPLPLARSIGLFLAVQFHGYWVEASQSIFLGGPRSEQRDAHEWALACFDEMLRGAAPGAVDDAGDWCDGARYRWVHGTGLDREEAPFPSSRGEPLVAGDILAAHVAVRRGGDVLFAGRPVVVTESGGNPLAPTFSLTLSANPV